MEKEYILEVANNRIRVKCGNTVLSDRASLVKLREFTNYIVEQSISKGDVSGVIRNNNLTIRAGDIRLKIVDYKKTLETCGLMSLLNSVNHLSRITSVNNKSKKIIGAIVFATLVTLGGIVIAGAHSCNSNELPDTSISGSDISYSDVSDTDTYVSDADFIISKDVYSVIEFDVGEKAEKTIKYMEENPDVCKIVKYYSECYGVDSNLIMAMIMQESSGIHKSTIDKNGGIGIMQIQYDQHIGSEIECYNFKTGKVDVIKVTDEALRTRDTNLRIGIAYAANCIRKNNNNNLMMGLQSYNYGPTKVLSLLKEYANKNGYTVPQVMECYEDLDWLDYLKEQMKGKNYGDINYISNVLRYLPCSQIINLDKDGIPYIYKYDCPSKVMS